MNDAPTPETDKQSFRMSIAATVMRVVPAELSSKLERQRDQAKFDRDEILARAIQTRLAYEAKGGRQVRRIAELEGEVAELRKDKERLDWLESQTEGYGNGWIFRASLTGRGKRLHEHSGPGCSPTVRQAIDAAKEQA